MKAKVIPVVIRAFEICDLEVRKVTSTDSMNKSDISIHEPMLGAAKVLRRILRPLAEDLKLWRRSMPPIRSEKEYSIFVRLIINFRAFLPYIFFYIIVFNVRKNFFKFLSKYLLIFQNFFQRLDRSLELNRTCNFAHKPENANKNRFENAVPFDQCRVILSIVIGSHTDTTYINASLVKVC